MLRSTAPRGVVYVEVLIALLPLLLTFLGICQLSLLYGAKMIVQHAATRGARAAMVVLEDAPGHYDHVERGDLTAGSGDADQGAGARSAAIRAAAYHPLAVLAPSLHSLGGRTLQTEIAEGALDRILEGRFFYNLGGAAITVHAPGSDEALTSVDKRDPVTVRVAYLMPCGVPLVSSLMCVGRMGRLTSWLGLNPDESTQRMLEMTEAVESPDIRTLILTVVPRLTLLTAEATMPNQGANYYGGGDR